jgi:hypothetical protein
MLGRFLKSLPTRDQVVEFVTQDDFILAVTSLPLMWFFLILMFSL